MTRTSALALIAAALLLVPSAASAASKEQQLLMAELRIMQQNQQMLQQSLITLAESLKTVTGRLDEQAGASRKGLADQRLLIEGMTDTVRALREKSDDTNVRLSSITQELESIRQTMATAPAPVAVAPAPTDPGADPAAAGLAPAPPTNAAPAPAAPPPGLSPQRAYETAYSDYAGGQYDLAVDGFQTFLKFFPRHMSADDAQLNIGNSLYNGGKFREAVTAYQRVISDYAGTDSVPAAHYKLGQTYMALKQNDLARNQFETLMQAFPRSNEATLAKQALDRIK